MRDSHLSLNSRILCDFTMHSIPIHRLTQGVKFTGQILQSSAEVKITAFDVSSGIQFSQSNGCLVDFLTVRNNCLCYFFPFIRPETNNNEFEKQIRDQYKFINYSKSLCRIVCPAINRTNCTTEWGRESSTYRLRVLPSTFVASPRLSFQSWIFLRRARNSGELIQLLNHPNLNCVLYYIIIAYMDANMPCAYRAPSVEFTDFNSSHRSCYSIVVFRALTRVKLCHTRGTEKTMANKTNCQFLRIY